ncbi:hypothetical protein D3C76_1797990 [compost metagenome]
MLAKNLRAQPGVRFPALSLTIIASNRASTGCSYREACFIARWRPIAGSRLYELQDQLAKGWR